MTGVYINFFILLTPESSNRPLALSFLNMKQFTVAVRTKINPLVCNSAVRADGS